MLRTVVKNCEISFIPGVEMFGAREYGARGLLVPFDIKLRVFRLRLSCVRHGGILKSPQHKIMNLGSAFRMKAEILNLTPRTRTPCP